jgi:heptosyltransferase-3
MSHEIHRILLIQLGDIGDVVLTGPALQLLRERFPNARISFCVREKAAELAAEFPWASDVIAVEKGGRTGAEEIRFQINWFSRLRKARYDVAVDLRTGTRGAVIAALSGARCKIGRFESDGKLWRNRVFHVLVDPPEEHREYSVRHHVNILQPLELGRDIPPLFLPISEFRTDNARRKLHEHGIPENQPLIAFHPFSLWSYKEWVPEEWACLIDHIHTTTEAQVIVTGAPEERTRAKRLVDRCRIPPVNLAGETPLADLPGILGCCRLFVGVDTAALHIAAAVGTPTIGIFGPSSPVSWAPRGPHHRVVQHQLPCVPCRDKGCDNREISRCLQELTWNEIRPVVDHVLADMPERIRA